MPNFKIFQDSPDQARIKIYGADSTGAAQALLTSTSGVMSTSGIVGVSGAVGISGSVAVSGAVGISGSVAVSGAVGISGSVAVSGAVAVSGPLQISGSVAVSGPVQISGSVAVSGAVAVSGPLQISGSVAVSGPVQISGSVAVSGAVAVSGPLQISGSVAVSGAVGISGTVALSGHSIVDSGPLSASVVPDTSGEVSGTFDILSYSSWILAVEYSGTSGDGVHVVLQKSAVSGGVASGGDYIFDSSGTFVSGNWLFFTTGVTPRYARLYYANPGTGSGTLYQTFQAQN